MTPTLGPWSGSFSVLVDPPTDEPITLDEAKLRAALAWETTDPPDPRDQLMRDFIAAARRKVEQDTGLALLTQVRDLYFAPLPYGSLVPLPSQSLPLQSIDTVDPLPPEIGRIRPIGVTGVAPQFGHGAEGFSAIDLTWGAVVRVTVGWLDQADLRLHAPNLLHAVGLLTAHYATTGRDLASAGITNEVPFGYEDAIAGHRLVWMI